MKVRRDTSVSAVIVLAAAVVLFLWPDIVSCLEGCWR